MLKDKHGRPWRVRRFRAANGYGSYGVVTSEGDLVCQSVCRADARLIVRGVNAQLEAQRYLDSLKKRGLLKKGKKR